MTRRALVIVGGGPAGLSAARGFRDVGGRGQVVVLAGEPRAPYRRPPLTKDYLRGEIDAGELPLEPPDWYAANQVELRTGVCAIALDPGARTVATEHDDLAFEHCVLATGAKPVRPPLPGADDPEVHTIRTVSDADALRALGSRASAIVVGSGFIGCEAAASLAMRGLAVTLVTDEDAPQAARLGAEVGERIAGWLREAGVVLRLGCPLAAIEPGGRSVELENGHRLDADVVLLALGIEPDVALASAAGLELDEGRVACDASGRSSAGGVLAAGDSARLHNPAAGRRLTVEHWGEALEQGEVAGRTAAGAKDEWDAVPGFWSTIGSRTIKQASWGDAQDEIRLEDHDGGWTAWYGAGGRCVGVLAHERDDDYERGRELIASEAPLPR